MAVVTMGHKKTSSYLPLPDKDIQGIGCSCGSSTLLPAHERSHKTHGWDSSRPTRITQLIFIVFGSLVISIISSAISISLYRPTDQDCARQLSVWSPVLEAVEYISHDFDNPFAHKTKYRGPPTPGVEEAWANLTNKHEVIVPERKLAALNRSLMTHPARVDGPYGRGYRANVEVFHQLHCLNLVRQYTWFQTGKYHDNPPAALAGGSDVARRMHVDHCIETLRLALMCNADVTPLVSIADADDPHGFRADFNAHHKCRDFGKIEAWMEENDVILG